MLVSFFSYIIEDNLNKDHCLKHVKLSDMKEFKDFVPVAREPEFISSDVATINLLFSGDVNGGIEKGVINMISADSSLGKSMIALKFLKNAQKKGMDCYVIDSEIAFNLKMAEDFGVDTSPDALTVFQTSKIVEIRQIVAKLAEGRSVEERRNTFIVLDSWGTLVSPVNISKAEEGSETKDMSLSQWKNDLANILKSCGQTYIVVNHVMANTGGFGDPLAVPGGKRLYYNSQNVVLGMSKAKDKNSDGEIEGAIITAMAHKGRTVKEKAKLQFRIKHSGGLDPFYGLLPDALEGGYVIKPKAGRYSRPSVPEDKEWKETDIYCKEFWAPLFKETDLKEYLKKKYTYQNVAKEEGEDDFAF